MLAEILASNKSALCLIFARLAFSFVLIVWGSCNKTLFDELEDIHVRAAKIMTVQTGAYQLKTF